MQRNRYGLAIRGLIVLAGLNAWLAYPALGSEQGDVKEWLRQKYDRVNPLFAQMRTLREQGQLAEARTVAFQMIQAAEEEFGPDVMYIFEGRLTIGESYAAEQRYTEADEVFQRLLTRLEELSRSDMEDMGKVMVTGLFIDYSRKIAAHYKA